MKYGKWWFDDSPEFKSEMNSGLETLLTVLEGGSQIESELYARTDPEIGVVWTGINRSSMERRRWSARFTEPSILVQEIMAAEWNKKHKQKTKRTQNEKRTK